MAVPDFQSIMLPLLKRLADKQDHRVADLREQLAAEFELSSEDLAQMLPSGRQSVFVNRVAWAQTYLKKAHLTETPVRGLLRSTPRGREVLQVAPDRITIGYLDRFPEFRAFREAEARQTEETQRDSQEAEDPDESLERAYRRARAAVEAELLQRAREASDAFFERLVVDVLVAMGYGGNRLDAGQAVGRSGDHGIDGVIKEDKLGLDAIYIQAKKWKDGSTVGRPDLQRFAGALQEHRARKGVFLTTATFAETAREYAKAIVTKIVLVDGPMLARLMYDHGVAVSTRATYDLKALDSDYFDAE